MQQMNNKQNNYKHLKRVCFSFFYTCWNNPGKVWGTYCPSVDSSRKRPTTDYSVRFREERYRARDTGLLQNKSFTPKS